ncbi:MAG: Na+/H+ antiporter NhaC family protein, partial [Clostridia bacterium]|nr:Na+/H+ antiporter NhaC family protein [Clostridia bacterium]
AVLIVSCVIGMLYNGGFFTPSSDYYLDLINAFGDCSASIALSWGSMIALIIIMIYFVARKLLTFKECMESIPQGFKAMVPAILILIFAWTLNTITGSLGADVYVHDVMENAKGLYNFLPAIIFVVAVGLSFSTGTSWGTFGILIPIVVNVFGANGGELLTIGISACLAGAVCGDHCSPISDTTIMASAGAKANHLNHVATQLPYALTVAAVSFITFIIAGFVQMWFVVLPIGIALMVGTLYAIKYLDEKKGTPTPEAVEVAPEVEA